MLDRTGIRDVRGNTTDDQTSTRKLVHNSVSLVDKKPQLEIHLRVDGVSQDVILQDEEQMKEINKTLEMLKSDSCTKSIRDDLKKKGDMIFSEESTRAIYEMGNMEFSRTETNLGDYSVSVLSAARTRGIEHVSMRRLASTLLGFVPGLRYSSSTTPASTSKSK